MSKPERWIEETFHPHWRVRLKADRVLHEVATEHQHLVIFENVTWGTVLMLDGVCQLTTRDEFIYHEMMAHVPLMAVAKPRRVLIIGGGDGGVLREALKHPTIEKATLVEIDRSVVDLSLAHYPQVAGGAFEDPRTDLVIGDGLAYVAETKERFDVIISDSSEPIGPSAVLHTPQFFADCRRALKPGGIFVTQSGLPFLLPEHLRQTRQVLGDLYGRVAPYLCTQPCYFGGPFALVAASDEGEVFELPLKKLARRQAKRAIATRYWTPDVHCASLALPGYVLEAIAPGSIAPASVAPDLEVAHEPAGAAQPEASPKAGKTGKRRPATSKTRGVSERRTARKTSR